MSSVAAAGEVIPTWSTFFTGEELAASMSGFDVLDSSRESSGEDGVDAVGSADRDMPGVMVADRNDWLLSSWNDNQ